MGALRTLGFGGGVAIVAIVASGLAACGPRTASDGAQGQPTSAPWATYAAPSTMNTDWKLSSWTVTKGSVDLIDSLWSAPGGLLSVDVDGTVPGEMKSSFATIPGKHYLVTFLLSANGACAARIKKLRVSAGRDSVLYTVDSKIVKAQASKWYSKRWSFKAIAPTTTLVLASEDDPGSMCGPAIAGVDVNLSR